jgi:hypothetical protein
MALRSASIDHLALRTAFAGARRSMAVSHFHMQSSMTPSGFAATAVARTARDRFLNES